LKFEVVAEKTAKNQEGSFLMQHRVFLSEKPTSCHS